MKTINYAKLHNAIQKLRRDDLFELLDRAIEQLPKTRFPKVFEGIIDLEKMTTINIQSELLTEDHTTNPLDFRKSTAPPFQMLC